MTSDLCALVVREATEHDADTIAKLVDCAGMGTLTPRGSILVATSSNAVVGFIRIVEIDKQHYVNPIVVAAHARRSGVGSSLMQEARIRYGELLFVARGQAVPFYEALGCKPVARERISPDLGEDCDNCPDFTTCCPVPMIYR